MDFRAMRLLALIALLGGAAVAQDALTGLPSLDPSKLGGDVFALGTVVLFIVQFIKRQVERPRKGPDGVEREFKPAPWLWWVVSVGLAELGAAGLHYARFGATVGDLPVPWGWLLFGLLAGLVASGFKDLVMGILKTPRPSSAPAVNVNVEAPAPAALSVPAQMNVTIERPASGPEPIPGLDAPAARGFLGEGLLALGLDALVGEFLAQRGIEATPARLLKIGARLALVIPDLADGSAYLSAESRTRITGVLMDLKAEGGLT